MHAEMLVKSCESLRELKENYFSLFFFSFFSIFHISLRNLFIKSNFSLGHGGRSDLPSDRGHGIVDLCSPSRAHRGLRVVLPGLLCREEHRGALRQRQLDRQHVPRRGVSEIYSLTLTYLITYLLIYLLIYFFTC